MINTRAQGASPCLLAVDSLKDAKWKSSACVDKEGESSPDYKEIKNPCSPHKLDLSKDYQGTL